MQHLQLFSIIKKAKNITFSLTRNFKIYLEVRKLLTVGQK